MLCVSLFFVAEESVNVIFSGRLHVCQKSQLAVVLEGKVTLPDAEPVTDAIIIDGSALFNTLPPRMSKISA